MLVHQSPASLTTIRNSSCAVFRSTLQSHGHAGSFSHFAPTGRARSGLPGFCYRPTSRRSIPLRRQSSQPQCRRDPLRSLRPRIRCSLRHHVHLRSTEDLAGSLMLDAIHCGAALHANAHPAERTARFAVHRYATWGAAHHQRSGNTRSLRN